MIETIGFELSPAEKADPPISFGRNGRIMTSGVVALDHVRRSVRVSPVTSKGEIASGYVAVHYSALPDLAAFLVKVALTHDPSLAQLVLDKVEAAAREAVGTLDESDAEALDALVAPRP